MQRLETTGNSICAISYSIDYETDSKANASVIDKMIREFDAEIRTTITAMEAGNGKKESESC